jgi:hypothetical protein
MKVTLYNATDPIEIDFQDKGHAYKVGGAKKTGVTTIVNCLSKPDLLPWAAYMAAEALKDAVMPYVTSATQITKLELKQLTDEAKKAHTRKSTWGKDVGSIVHEWIKEEIGQGKEVKVPHSIVEANLELAKNNKFKEVKDLQTNYKTAEYCVSQWRKWVADYGIEFIKTEQIVYSKRLDYCGTMDTLFYSSRLEKTFIGDYKTSEPQKKRNSRFQIVGHKPYPEHFAQIAGYDLAYNEETEITPDGYMVIYLPKNKPYQAFTRHDVANDRLGWEGLVTAYNWIDKVKKGKEDAKQST